MMRMWRHCEQSVAKTLGQGAVGRNTLNARENPFSNVFFSKDIKKIMEERERKTFQENAFKVLSRYRRIFLIISLVSRSFFMGMGNQLSFLHLSFFLIISLPFIFNFFIQFPIFFLFINSSLFLGFSFDLVFFFIFAHF